MTPAANPNPAAPGELPASRPGRRVRRAGRLAWALLGLLGVAVAVGFLASQLTLVIVPVVLALFPATLVLPVSRRLKQWGLPAALASLLTLVGGLLLLLGAIGAMIPLVIDEAPRLAESAGDGVAELEALIGRIVPGFQFGGIDDLLALGQEQEGGVGSVATQALGTAITAIETLAGATLILVVLFFYLKDEHGLVRGIMRLVPLRHRPRAFGIADRAWATLAAYFRGQLLVAAFDAVAIGLGLWALGVPLVLPLSLIIFFGGLFPIVGAFASGLLAVLVGLASGGLWIGLGVLGVVVVVQQLEGNVMEPLILSRVINLHPLVIILAITGGGLLLGLLGAFLAVPAAAITARTARYLQDDGDEPSPGAPATTGDPA